MHSRPTSQDPSRGGRPAEGPRSLDRPTAAVCPRAAPSLAGNFAWGLLGNVALGACQWGVVILLARWGDTLMVGQFALAMAVTTPVVLLAGLALRTVQATDARADFRFGEYLALRLLTSAAAAAVIAGFVALAPLDAVACGTVLAVGAAKLVDSLSDLLYGVFQQHERMDLVGRSQVLRGAASLVLGALGVGMSGSVLWASLGLVAASAAVLAAYDLPAAVRLGGAEQSWTSWLRPSWEWGRIGRLWRLTLPLGVTVMLGALIANLPRYFVEWFLGTAELGVFAALAWITTAGSMVVNALAHSATPRLARYYAAGGAAAFCGLLVRLLAGAAGLATAAVLLAWGLGPTLLNAVYGPDYTGQQEVFLWLTVSLGIGFGICVLDNALYAARRFSVQVPINAAVVVVSGAACTAAVPRLGLRGAAVVVAATSLVQLLARVGPVWVAVREISTAARGAALSDAVVDHTAAPMLSSHP